MATCPINLINGHPGDEVGIRRFDGILSFRCAACDRGIQKALRSLFRADSLGYPPGGQPYQAGARGTPPKAQRQLPLQIREQTCALKVLIQIFVLCLSIGEHEKHPIPWLPFPHSGPSRREQISLIRKRNQSTTGSSVRKDGVFLDDQNTKFRFDPLRVPFTSDCGNTVAYALRVSAS